MTNKILAPRGTADILPDEIDQWTDIESIARTVFKKYNYEEIRTPIFESTGLFKRSLGQTSDVVHKQLLELRSQKEHDESDDVFALRPEGTASIVRSYIENDFHKKEPVTKLFYLGAMFRGERPQKGRLRQFHQIGAEAIGPGTLNPFLDAEMIALSLRLLAEFGVTGPRVKINNLGDSEDKQNFSKYLRSQLKGALPSLCDDCKDRFERNVFRILDCKNSKCVETVDRLKLDDSSLKPESKVYFSKVIDALNILKIPHERSVKLVRGLDYYNYTVFEIVHEGLGSQNALGAGGRYNQLFSQLGGKAQTEVGAVGFSLGMERILLSKKSHAAKVPRIDAFVIALDERSFQKAFGILDELRKADISADIDYKAGSMKSQMRTADKFGARYAIILGENELNNGVLTLKNMSTSQQTELKLSDINHLADHIKNNKG